MTVVRSDRSSKLAVAVVVAGDEFTVDLPPDDFTMMALVTLTAMMVNLAPTGALVGVDMSMSYTTTERG